MRSVKAKQLVKCLSIDFQTPLLSVERNKYTVIGQ